MTLPPSDSPRLIAEPWLVAQPIAHRGLHGVGRIENTLEAAEAAIQKSFAIECDIQLTRDGEAVVFHDFGLERLMKAEGQVVDFSASELRALTFRESGSAIATLSTFLGRVAGRVPVIVEIKSRFDGDMRLADRALAVVADYGGPVALKSFDPVVMARCRAAAPRCPLGFIAQSHYDDDEWHGVPSAILSAMRDFSFYPAVRPDFLSFCARDLPHVAVSLYRYALDLPVMSWTIQSADEATAALRFVDQIVFEGFEPRE